jgi:hypothetical protein
MLGRAKAVGLGDAGMLPALASLCVDGGAAYTEGQCANFCSGIGSTLKDHGMPAICFTP